MNAVVVPVALARQSPLRSLAMLESRAYLTRASVWIGLALSILIPIVEDAGDWPGASYESLSLALAPLMLGMYIAGLRTGGRDRVGRGEGLAEEAALGAPQRTIARLIGLIVPVALGAMMIIAIAVATRIEGGFWLGEAPRRTDTALHSVPELLQPVLLIALAGTAGVMLGRVTRHTTPAAIIGVVVWFMTIVTSWMWNSPPAHTVALAQVQPMRIGLGSIGDPATLPGDWLVVGPGRYQDEWERQLVHVPTVLGHDVYLIGLIGICVGFAIRGAFGRRTAVAGLMISIAGVVAQLVVSPV